MYVRAIAPEVRQVRQESGVACHNLGWLLGGEAARTDLAHHALVEHYAVAAWEAADFRPRWLLPEP